VRRPESWNLGGEIVAQGTLEDVAGVTRSHTGRFLRDVLDLPAEEAELA
jgi:excinuclease ABC subunit A